MVGQCCSQRQCADQLSDRPVVCIGTDFDSQKKYDAFISARGISPHLDWYNLNTDEMLKADFPIYAYDQRVGDLVVFPPATAHQVWNPSTLSTKMVWNILHPLSLEVGFQNVQPSFNRLCHPDLARTNLSLACAMMSLLRDTQTSTPTPLPPDLPLLSRLFRQMVHDESIDDPPATPIQLIILPDTVIATCNFCSTAIWNRHVRCTQCSDFDLCLLCYLNGRSCEHTNSYAWAEIIPPEHCNQILNRAREIMGFQPEAPPAADRQKTLGTAVNDLMRAKNSQATRLCHLCRIDHPEWRGRRCDKCTAFFCYRGLFRHFDMSPGDILRQEGQWTCPKCQEVCNCRCCHFSTAYMKSEKPASKRRVKAADSRGKNMGFADNVFDQKRGRRESHQNEHGTLPGVSSIARNDRLLLRPALDLRRRYGRLSFRLQNRITAIALIGSSAARDRGSSLILRSPTSPDQFLGVWATSCRV
jgi:Zinc-finger domain of monoamine-oxidase A repressor R1/Zinc finger, ZZ type